MKKTFYTALTATLVLLVTVAGLFSFNTARAQAPYCDFDNTAAPSLNYGGTITDFTIKDYNTNVVVFNQTTANPGGIYLDYTGVTINLIQGKTYIFEYTVNTGSGGNVPYGSCIGVAWTGDYNFAGGSDRISYTDKTSVALRTFTYTLTQPTGNYRLRVCCKYNLNNLFPCNFSSRRGEFQDYTLNVAPSCTAPSTNASNFSATPNVKRITASWTRGNGTAGVIVVARENYRTAAPPPSGTDSYTPNTVFGQGSTTGAYNYVVYKGTGTSVEVTGLNAGTNYAFDIYEYNTTDVCYKLPGYTNSVTTLTCTPPTVQPGTPSRDAATNTTLKYSWTRGNGAKVIGVISKVSNPIASPPESGISYTANTAWGVGDDLGSENYVVYVGTGTTVTVTGLLPNTQYYLTLYEFNEGPPCYQVPNYPSKNWQQTTDLMYFVSSTTAQNNTDIKRGTNNQWLVQVQVVVAGTTTPMKVTSLTFNTTGTTNPADISQARVYGTTTSPVFSDSYNPSGGVVVNPNGTHTINFTNPYVTLYNGTNYLWLAYNVSSSAALGNYAKAAVTSITLSDAGGQNGGAKTPDNTTTASRKIVSGYCLPYTSTNCVSPNYYGAITKVELSTISNSSPNTCGTLVRGYSDYSDIVTTADMDADGFTSYPFTITRAASQDANYTMGIWIDLNRDGVFNNTNYPAGERFYAAVVGNSTSVTGNLVLPGSATAGETFMRIRVYHNADLNALNPCDFSVVDYGEAEDYRINIISTCTPPALEASALNVSVGVTGLDLNWTRGDGDSVLVIARQGNSVTGTPALGTPYTDNSVFGSGSQIGSGNYVVYSGTGNSVTVTGLTPLATYSFAVYEYNAGNCYLLSSPATGTGTFCTQPVTQASGFTGGAATNTTVSVSWTRGSGNSVMVVARSGSAVNALPAGGTSYSANAAFGSGDQMGSGNYVVYNGTGTSVTVTGLTLNTSYHFAIFEYSNGGPCYKSPALTGVATTANVMNFLSSTTTQNNADVRPGSNNEMLVGLQVVTEGATSPISVTGITFNTNGSTYPVNDLGTARIYYTGTSPVFSAINPFGSAIVGPDGTYALTGTQVLASGTNYFWLAYDIKPGAKLFNYAKGAVTTLDMNMGVGTVIPGSIATASRRINLIYCTVAYDAACTLNGQISRVKISNMNNITGCSPGSYGDYTTLDPILLERGQSYPLTIKRGDSTNVNSYTTRIWIDFNDDEDFADAGEQVFDYSSNAGTISGNITISGGAQSGIHRMRVRIGYYGGNNLLYCGNYTSSPYVTHGEVEDYLVNICDKATINTQPVAQTICEQEEVNLFVSATSPSSMTYQWYKNNILLPGMIASNVAGPAALADAGNYKCIITNGCGAVTSNTVALTVKTLPALTVSPVSAVCTGTATAHLTASGASSYSWAPALYLVPTNAPVNVNNITVATSQLTFYTVTGTAVNGCTKDQVVPVATVPVGGTVDPSHSIVCSGGSQLLKVNNAAGSSYLWQSSSDAITWSDIAGETNNSYTPTISAKTYYRLVGKSNACWDVASTTATVDVSATPITLAVTGKTDNSITLNWGPVGNGNYSISYDGPNSGSASNVTPPYTITGLISNSSYSITVTQTGLPLVSCPASGDTSGVTTLCAVPTGITVSSPANKQLKVDWTGGAGIYRVYYRALSIQNAYSFKDVTIGNNNGSATIAVSYGSVTYEVYVVRLNCPNPGDLGQKSALYNTIVKPLSACTPEAVINNVISTCPGQIEVSMSNSPTGDYVVYIQRLTPTVAGAVKYNVSGNTFQIHVGQPGQTFAVGVASKCVSGTGNIVMWPGGITIKPLCNPIGNLMLSSPTCRGFTASWNREICSENQVSTYQFFMKRTGTLTWNSYPVNSPVAPISPSLKVSWLGKGYEMNCYVKANYICNGYVIGGPSSLTQTITTLSAGCREEEENVLEPETPSTQIISPDNSEAISIYPNPNNGQFTLDISRLSNETVQVRTEVMNVLGQTVLTNISEANSGHGNEIITLPASVAAGTYFVRVTVGSNVYTAMVNVSK